MSTVFSMLSIMNAALISQGFEVISPDDGSDEWELMSRNWPQIVEAELEVGKYNFTRKQAFLASRQDGAYGLSDAYLIPAAALVVRRVWYEDAQGCRFALDWSQDNTRVFVNWNAGVFIEYLEAADPGFWGANFSLGVQMRLEAVCMRNRERGDEAVDMEKAAEAFFQVARTVSSQSRSATKAYLPSRYSTARFSRG